MELREFLKMEQPEAYDFKNLMGAYYRSWAGKHEGDWEYQALLDRMPEMDRAEGIEKWYLYKSLDADLNKRILRFDCDSWNGTCDLTDQIYAALWPAGLLENAGVRLGGDTMNSFASLFNHFTGEASFRRSYGRCQSRLETGFQAEADRVLGALAHNTGCLGNFTLVPSRFNRYRGTRLGDFFDLSLMELKANGAKWFGTESEDVFTQYVNLFFLWDYTEVKGEEYEVRPFFEGHSKELMFPADREQLDECVETINTNIRRRGTFMVKLLKLALEQPEAYRRMQECLADPALRFESVEDALRHI